MPNIGGIPMALDGTVPRSNGVDLVDYSVFHSINSLAGQFDSVDDLFELAASFVPFLLIALLFGLWFWPGDRSEKDLRQWACISAFGAAMAGLALNQLIGMLWDRPRPFVAHSATLLIAHSADGSFPSDHATFAFAVAVSIVLVNRTLGVVALLLAAAMSFARVYVGVHYASDVIAGAAIGSVAALAMYQTRPYVAPVLAHPMRVLQRVHLG